MDNLFANFWFLVVAAYTITSVVSTIAKHWERVRQAEIEGALKQEMLQRGMSAADIQQVIEASGKRKVKGADAGAAPEPVQAPAPASAQ